MLLVALVSAGFSSALTALILLWRLKGNRVKVVKVRQPMEVKEKSKVRAKSRVTVTPVRVSRSLSSLVADTAMLLEEKQGFKGIEVAEKLGKMIEEGIIDRLDLEILNLHLQGYSQYKIAKITGVSVATVNRRLKKIKKKLEVKESIAIA